MERILIATPVYNEAEHLERTVAAMAAQSRLPDRWLVIDDNSTDGTHALATRLAAEHPWMEVLRAPAAADEPADRLAVAKEARAFNRALATVDLRAYTHVGKLDGDVELPPHWYATLLEAFRADPRLGIAGGRLIEPSPDGWGRIEIPSYHVHGALKLFRRECLEAVGGIQERLGWDTIDETYARMHGWHTHSFESLVARHHRHWGSADGRLRGRARHGECAYIVRYPFPWVVARSLKVAKAPPVGLSGAAFVFGYVRAAARSRDRVEDVDFRRFVRGELAGRARRITRIST